MGIKVKAFNKMLHKRQTLATILYKIFYISYPEWRILCQNKVKAISNSYFYLAKMSPFDLDITGTRNEWFI